MQEWSSRLEDSINTEHRLLRQVRELQEERTATQQRIDDLMAERHGLQKKVTSLSVPTAAKVFWSLLRE